MSHNALLTKIYFDLKSPGSFGGLRKLFLEAKKVSPNISFKQVLKWGQDELTYNLHKQIRRNFLRNKILVQRKNEQFEADLVDMTKLSNYNSGYKYILNVIDCFSKFLYSFPLKNKQANEIIDAFKKLFLITKPQKLRTDRGLEFKNNLFNKFMEINGVNHFTSNDTKIKCAIVERVNRTLK